MYFVIRLIFADILILDVQDPASDTVFQQGAP